MKKIIFAFSLLLGSAALVNAQDTTATQKDRESYTAEQPAMQQQDDWTEKEKITAAELPQNIRQQLQGQNYAGWTVKNAWRKEKESKTWYAVELTDGSQTKKVKFDAEGNVVKEKTKSKDQ